MRIKYKKKFTDIMEQLSNELKLNNTELASYNKTTIEIISKYIAILHDLEKQAPDLKCSFATLNNIKHLERLINCFKLKEQAVGASQYGLNNSIKQ